MTFARRVFLFAGIWGLVVMTPQWFLEAQLGRDFPPSISHAEFYYGFVGVVHAWQIAFLIIAWDPLRYRMIMVPAILEKVAFAAAVLVLYLQSRVAATMLGFAAVDLTFALLFLTAFVKVSRVPAYLKTRWATADSRSQ